MTQKIKCASFLFLLIFTFTTFQLLAEDNVNNESFSLEKKSGFPGNPKLTNTRNWRKPDYSGQENSLGYSKGVFNIPIGMEKQVEFWKKIYTQYTTEQGLIHDRDNIQNIYETIDFAFINADPNLTSFQKQKAREKLVEEKKKKIAEVLLSCHDKPQAENWTESQNKICKLYDNSNEPNKFFEASNIDRIRFQLGQKNRLEMGIYFSGRYLESFEDLFKSEGLPIELTRLIFVESSFNVLARSKIGASGLWQIMSYTAKPYMSINKVIDRRNHPNEATKLAAKLLRQNFQVLNSWPLAITAYNHGSAGVKRISQHQKTENIAEIVQNLKSEKKLGFASRNFYACFLAILEIEQVAPTYFPDIKWSETLESREFKLTRGAAFKEIVPFFSSLNNSGEETIQIFNPHIMNDGRKNRYLIPKGTIINIPAAQYSLVSNYFQENPNPPMIPKYVSPNSSAKRSISSVGKSLKKKGTGNLKKEIENSTN
jgi:membrane-bound lytic murein transglycosylase D